MESEPIKRESIVSQLAVKIQEYIAENDLKEDDKLPSEKELCLRFNVGRSSVREAIRLLQANGLITIRRGKGYYVANSTSPISSKEWFISMDATLSDYSEVRLQNEILAAQLASMRATADDLINIRDIYERFVIASRSGKAADCAKLDEAFHLAIATASHNSLLLAIIEAINEVIFEYRLKTFSLDLGEYSIAQHEAILEALEKRDTALSVQAMTVHIKRVYLDVAETYK